MSDNEKGAVAWLRKNGFRFNGDIEPQDDSEVPLYTRPALTDEVSRLTGELEQMREKLVDTEMLMVRSLEGAGKKVKRLESELERSRQECERLREIANQYLHNMGFIETETKLHKDLTALSQPGKGSDEAVANLPVLPQAIRQGEGRSHLPAPARPLRKDVLPVFALWCVCRLPFWY